MYSPVTAIQPLTPELDQPLNTKTSVPKGNNPVVSNDPGTNTMDEPEDPVMAGPPAPEVYQPVAPLDSDCCGSGCTPCILDIYQQELEIAKRRRTSNLKSSKLTPDEYTEFELIDILPATAGVANTANIYRFRLPKDTRLGHKAGQHLIIRETLAETPRCSLVRQYSILSDPGQLDHFDLLVKVYEEGRMSSVVREWKIGRRVEMRGPAGDFRHQQGRQKKLILVCQGTGIVPFISIIREILENGDDETVIRLLYSTRRFSDILAVDHIMEFSDYWNFSTSIFLSQDLGSGRLLGPNKEIVRARLEYVHLQSEVSDGSDSYVAVCGSKEYIKAICSYLQSLQVSPENIFRF